MFIWSNEMIIETYCCTIIRFLFAQIILVCVIVMVLIFHLTSVFQVFFSHQLQFQGTALYIKLVAVCCTMDSAREQFLSLWTFFPSQGIRNCLFPIQKMSIWNMLFENLDILSKHDLCIWNFPSQLIQFLQQHICSYVHMLILTGLDDQIFGVIRRVTFCVRLRGYNAEWVSFLAMHSSVSKCFVLS